MKRIAADSMITLKYKTNHPFFGSMAVHYKAWTESTQHKFEDTWQEQQPLELVIGKGEHCDFSVFLYFSISRSSPNLLAALVISYHHMQLEFS